MPPTTEYATITAVQTLPPGYGSPYTFTVLYGGRETLFFAPHNEEFPTPKSGDVWLPGTLRMVEGWLRSLRVPKRKQ